MIPLATAEALAREVVALLRPACQEIAIVGSIRRRKAEVKDIEILARPKPPKPTFGDPRSAGSQLEALIPKLIERRDLALNPDTTKRKDGPRYKTLWLKAAGGITIDLFIADPSGDNWGNLTAIRTGDFEFSRLLVTKQSAGGLMPRGLLHHEGYLCQLGNVRIPCPTEEAFFKALSITRIPEPSKRTEAMARRLAAIAAAKREQVRA